MLLTYAKALKAALVLFDAITVRVARQAWATPART